MPAPQSATTPRRNQTSPSGPWSRILSQATKAAGLLPAVASSTGCPMRSPPLRRPPMPDKGSSRRARSRPVPPALQATQSGSGESQLRLRKTRIEQKASAPLPVKFPNQPPTLKHLFSSAYAKPPTKPYLPPIHLIGAVPRCLRNSSSALFLFDLEAFHG